MVVGDIVAEVIEEHGLPTPFTWIEHYPEHRGGPGEYSLVAFSSWECEEVCLGGVWRYRVGSPRWTHLTPEEVGRLLGDEMTVLEERPQAHDRPF